MADYRKELKERLRENAQREAEVFIGDKRVRASDLAADLIESLERRLTSVTESYERMKAARTVALRERDKFFKDLAVTEDELRRAEADAERDAAVLEALTSDGVSEVLAKRIYLRARLVGDWDDLRPANRQRLLNWAQADTEAALQHAQEQVGEGQ